MPTLVSPGVAIVEKDLTNVTSSVASTTGGFAGTFRWGPVEVPMLINNEANLVSVFGQPDTASAVSFFTAANFLSYTSALNVVRVVGTLAKNAVATGTAVLIKNRDNYETAYANGQGTVGPWAAKYPGAIANGLAVEIADAGIYNGTYIDTIEVLTPGAGYSVAPTVAVVGTGTGATATATINGSGAITAITVTNRGTGYTGTPTVTLTGGTPTTPATTAVHTAASGDGWPYKTLFSSAPGTSEFVATRGGSNDEVHVVVIDTFGKFSGTPGTVLEVFPFLSKASDARDYSNLSSYYATYVSNASSYIYWMDHPTATNATLGTTAAGTTFGSITGLSSVSLQGGVSDDTLTDAIAMKGYDLFANPEVIDVSLIPLGGASGTVANYVISNIVLKRLDCLAFVSPKITDVVNNAGQEVTDILLTRNALPSTSYAVMDSGWKYQFDKYNGVYRWIPLNGDVAGLCARTDSTNDAWWSPAGLNRGQINNSVKLAFSPNNAERDVLYPVGINPVINIVGQGTVLYGDKTLLSKPSAFDRINVRRLFIVLEKSVAKMSKYSLFEFNDPLTRSQFKAAVNPYLRDIQGRRGITDFLVVCDETNNTQQVIDSNSFVGSIYVKPSRSVNYITLYFTAVASGVSFSTVTSA